MTQTFASRNEYRILLSAATTAAVAAILMITVWGPLQIRAFDRAAQEEWVGTSAETSAASTANTQWDRIPFVTDAGETTNLAASNGQIRIVTMLYTHCPGVCPLAVSTLQQITSRLRPAQQKRLSVVALSLDPERDSVETLRSFRAARGIGSLQWVLARASIGGTHRLASALGVRYRVVDDGSVDHQSLFVLLGKSGQVLASSSNTRAVDPRFFGALQAALNAN